MNAIESNNKIEFESEQQLQSYLKMKRMLGRPVAIGVAS